MDFERFAILKKQKINRLYNEFRYSRTPYLVIIVYIERRSRRENLNFFFFEYLSTIFATVLHITYEQKR